jgi:hypothetical protein
MNVRDVYKVEIEFANDNLGMWFRNYCLAFPHLHIHLYI